jgi:hypothetical protein
MEILAMLRGHRHDPGKEALVSFLNGSLPSLLLAQWRFG